uniref:CMP/dCMP-type deaminase domain-containing protein n=1 Tax=Chromera velia CCMP2878 TaxID=1169474 RepID=A0A0G4GMR0_9ALVE|eukprot:Cvel_22586.t1-p1 / transcript=Cvel_22586.t1 / gene=Cvel_22586 / organism=Chromera_velia_CCMP2878 / gene_product=hypothetical protein / transcript_product=hypothetical protein / location=Cvel_scaffold2233:22141-23955(+) / protein_length=293 / sequence_SO=supercontig / SO=protein_coding / is_pseudo=false
MSLRLRGRRARPALSSPVPNGAALNQAQCLAHQQHHQHSSQQQHCRNQERNREEREREEDSPPHLRHPHHHHSKYQYESLYESSDEFNKETNNLLNKHYYALEAAIQQAEKSPYLHKHGCVIVSRGKVVASGHNRPANGISSLHAECAALKEFKKKVTRGGGRRLSASAVMFVVRLHPHSRPPHHSPSTSTDVPAGGWRLLLSAPCDACVRAIQAAGIRTVFFSVNSPPPPQQRGGRVGRMKNGADAEDSTRNGSVGPDESQSQREENKAHASSPEGDEDAIGRIRRGGSARV